MALPDAAAIKRVLKVEHTSDDTLIGELRTRALALIQKYIGCPITAVERTFTDWAETQVLGSSGPRSLIVPETPIDPTSLAITDYGANVVDADDLTVDAETGIIRFTDGSRFTAGPYTITVEVGLSALDTFEAEVEPVVAGALCDTVADFYFARNPRATSESSSGVSRSYTEDELPARVRASLNAIRRAV